MEIDHVSGETAYNGSYFGNHLVRIFHDHEIRLAFPAWAQYYVEVFSVSPHRSHVKPSVGVPADYSLNLRELFSSNRFLGKRSPPTHYEL